MKPCNMCSKAPTRHALGNHRFCSHECVVQYAGTNKNVQWINSEHYRMVERLVDEAKAEHEQKDLGHQDDAPVVVLPEETGS
jgi:hypothetical protein